MLTLLQDGVGSTISQGKDRASKRFSRSRVESQAEQPAAVSDSAVSAPNTSAEVVPTPAHSTVGPTGVPVATPAVAAA